MRKLAFILFLITAMATGATETTGEPLRLMDGSYLYISEDETMRMVNKDGKPIEMKDGVEMELEDGTLIMMMNKKIWRHDHRKHKGLR
jgi:hypothetical protein